MTIPNATSPSASRARFLLRPEVYDKGLCEAFVSARTEILTRVELRDRLVTNSFSISIAILGGTMLSKDPMIGLLVPVFAFGSSLVACQHTSAIHSICSWSRREVPFPHFARSKELRKLHRSDIAARAVAQSAIFMAPSFVALTYAYSAAFSDVSVLLSGLWWAGVLLVLGIAFVQWRTLARVVALNRHTGYESARKLSGRIERLARSRASMPAHSEENQGSTRQPADGARVPMSTEQATSRG